MSFSESLIDFDGKHKGVASIPRSLCTVDGKFIENVIIRNVKGERLEEYYKWQFIHALIASGLYHRDYIGAEIYLPKGNIGSTPIKIDACIFSSLEWIDLYRKYREQRDQDALDAVRRLMIGVIEFKRAGKRIDQVFNSQIKASIKESDAKTVYGYYYDEGRLYIFKRGENGIQRLDGAKNFPRSQRVLEQFQLELTDPYFLIPDFKHAIKFNSEENGDINDSLDIDLLDPVYTVNGDNIKIALNRILRALDLQSMVDDHGYMLVIHLIAAKVYDEKQAISFKSPLKFFVTDEEAGFKSLMDDAIESFIARMSKLLNDAKGFYKAILADDVIDWAQISHVKAAVAVVKNLQTFSLVRSRRKDLYQLLFYNFATALKKDQNAQFLTPLPIIEFIVEIVNPQKNEKVLDPCCGPSDFLAASLARNGMGVRAEDLYGIDNDKKMILLSNLNLLLSGDGNPVVTHVPDQGSLTNKFDSNGSIRELHTSKHRSGKWHNWPDKTKLMQFDVVLTNPPFGKGRNLSLNNTHDRHAAEFYELYDKYIESNPKDGLDLGVVFLENAVRSIGPGGRFGIVLSNSIASNNTWQFAREWLMTQVRIVALFDLPPNIFAETGVNTTVIVGYKPKAQPLEQLIKSDYEVFAREVQNVGYERRTLNRNIIFEEVYRLNEETFEVMMDPNGEPARLEDFSGIVAEFREWCAFQEAELRDLFIGERV
ncbi:N-6 DNA methylase [Sinorhizobium meliloti]|nr:N-6 DNA methylase [Sinorhizobium meliloti]MDW9453678.1 N-6 DNA methylase [Sinorhizobium meliloti]